MELKMIKHQRGYLLIVAIIAIVIIGFIASILVNMYVTSTTSTTNVLQSDQAYYIAKAGLEIARRDIMKTTSPTMCEDINGLSKFTNAYYPIGSGPTTCTGQFIVTGDENRVTSTVRLSSGITATATTIPLTGAGISSLLSKGVVVIENEAIWYPSRSSTQLLNVKRGVFGTTAVAHTVGVSPTYRPVIQNVCTLTSTAGVSTLTNPGGKRILKEMLWKKTTSASGGIGTLPGGMAPTLIGAQTVSLYGNANAFNPSVTLNGPGFPNSTIVSGGDLVFNGNAHTEVGNHDRASPTIHDGEFLLDVSEYNSNITTSTLWGYLFTQSKDTVHWASTTTRVTNCNTASNFTGPNRTFWCTNFNVAANNVIGSINPLSPVTIIVEQNATLGGNAIVNGFLYVIQGVTVEGNAIVNGLTAAEGAMNIGGNGLKYFDVAILTALGLLGTAYNPYYASWEDFD